MTYLDPDCYLVDDPEAEEKWDFQLRKTLKATRNLSLPRLLHGMVFYATISVQPSAEVLKEIVQAAGGKVSVYLMKVDLRRA